MLVWQRLATFRIADFSGKQEGARLLGLFEPSSCSPQTAVLYELHVGTFSPEGTFRDVVSKLDHLVSLGVTAIEIMPIGAFPGRRNWGCDVIFPYACQYTYGSPDDLKHLVDEAHARGLMVLLDVVYNHFGPEGNLLALYAPDFFTEHHHTPLRGLRWQHCSIRSRARRRVRVPR
jgi:1,4-alpha-glucan branching enzyme